MVMPVHRLNMSIGVINNEHDRTGTCEAYMHGSGEKPTTVFPHCPYFARKFARGSHEAIASLLDRLGIAWKNEEAAS